MSSNKSIAYISEAFELMKSLRNGTYLEVADEEISPEDRATYLENALEATEIESYIESVSDQYTTESSKDINEATKDVASIIKNANILLGCKKSVIDTLDTDVRVLSKNSAAKTLAKKIVEEIGDTPVKTVIKEARATAKAAVAKNGCPFEAVKQFLGIKSKKDLSEINADLEAAIDDCKG